MNKFTQNKLKMLKKSLIINIVNLPSTVRFIDEDVIER